MNNYIGTIKNGYMFTNNRKQAEEMASELANGNDPFIFNYDKLGKSIGFKYWIQDNYGNDFGYIKSLDYDTGYFNYTDDIDEAMIIPSYIWLKKQKWNIPDFDREHWGEEIYQGTGKINAKYRVVEVYRLGIDFNRSDVFDMSNFKDHKYAIKCSLIEKVDMELSSFVNPKKWSKKLNTTPCYYKGKMLFSGYDNCKLTRYNGLTKVFKIGDE